MNRNLDRVIWIFTILIIGFGLLALYSASFYNVRVTQKVFYDQLLGAGIGLALMFLISQIDYRRFYDAAYFFYAFNIILLIYVLVSGRHALGARRWLEIGGFSFQPSELTKLAVILMLGRYYSVHRSRANFRKCTMIESVNRDILVPLTFIAVPMVMIFKQPDLGTAILIFGIFVLLLFVCGTPYKIIAWFLGLCFAVMPFAWHILKPYQRDRLLVFLNPNIDPLGAGYTIIQSKIAIGSGQLFGKGWLAGTQNQLNFLPERHTDFIFSVIGEEWGLMGSLFLVTCYSIVIYAGLKISEQVKDEFGSFVTIGIVGILTLQVVINIGMVIGILPVVGIPLPLVSYGRTSLLFFMVMLGFLINLSKRRTVF